MNNAQIREQFNEYYTQNHKPSLVLIAKEIGISHAYLYQFKNGRRDISDKLLARIKAFIEQ